MEPDDLIARIGGCPFRITMNTGETFDVEKAEVITVAETTATCWSLAMGTKETSCWHS